MSTDSFWRREKFFIGKGATVGFKVSFWTSFLYIPTFLIFSWIIMNFFTSSNAATQSLASGKTDPMFIGGFIFVYFICIIGILPATIIGTIGGTIIGFLFAVFSKKMTNFLAGFIGFVVGIGLILLVNYLFWLVVISPYPYSHTPFIEYLLPINIYDFGVFIFSVNFYFIPSIIAILLSPYIGLKIYKLSISNTTFLFKE